MAGPAVLATRIVTDASQAQSEMRGAADAIDKVGAAGRAATGKLDSASSAVKDYGNASEAAARASRDVAGNIDTAGSASQRTAGGIRDMAGALEGTKFEAVGQSAVAASTYFEAAAGAGDLFSAAMDYLKLANLKAMASTVKNTAATVASKVASMAAAAASKAWAVAQAALNIVLSANPIGIIIIAVIALVAAIVLAYKNSETFRRIVQAVFKAVLTAIKAVVDFVVRALTPVWKAVAAAVSVAVNLVKGYITIWITVITTVVNLIKSGLIGAFNILRSVGTTVLAVITAPWRALSTAIGWVIDKIEDLIGWISRIRLPDIGGFIDKINPFTATAATATATVATTRVGLPRGATRTSSTRSSGGGIVVNVAVPPTANPVEVGRQIVTMVRRFERAAGAGWRNGTVVP